MLPSNTAYGSLGWCFDIFNSPSITAPLRKRPSHGGGKALNLDKTLAKDITQHGMPAA